MSYREPRTRPPRLWYVSLTFGTQISVGVEITTLTSWAWAKEQSDAIEAALVAAKKAGYNVPAQYTAKAVCGEDFAEFEAKGPPGAEP